ncbi:MAG: DNA topoisomerase IV subunit B [Flavobacteriales bacterium AspAUS03]
MQLDSYLTSYTEEDIRSLDWNEHIRLRPGMYIGKLGDGSAPDDGIYILIKEIIDNAVDEFVMGKGKIIELTIKEDTVHVRDYGRGIPLGKVVEAVAKMNTGGKYDSCAFKKSIGLNGVGTKVVNTLSAHFNIRSIREKKSVNASFKRGILVEKKEESSNGFPNGTMVSFSPDPEIFGPFTFHFEYIEQMLKNYVCLNSGLIILLNGKKFYSENGLRDFLEEAINEEMAHPIIHLKGDDIELAFTYSLRPYNERYFSFVNGQHTTQGGTHQAIFRESFVKTIREFFNKNYDSADIRKALIAALSIKVIEPIFDSQTKTKLGSNNMGPDLPSIRSFVLGFVKNQLDNFLHRTPNIAEKIQQRILLSGEERKEFAGVQKIARERAKKVGLHNKKLRDCRQHYNNSRVSRREETTLFITEGDSASGSITKSRDVEVQAIFSLRGKPLNTYNLTKKIVYENEEFNLLQAALNIENELEGLRYNRVVLATDADVDGLHIRLLMITFFLQFFPELVQKGHLYILQTPLFRVRNKKENVYCYTEAERLDALSRLGKNPEITRFKGLGEISPDEFKYFIGNEMRIDPVIVPKDTDVKKLLEFYMGKNTPDRQAFIIDRLKTEQDFHEMSAY